MEVKRRAFEWSKNAKLYLRTHSAAYQILQNDLKLIDEGEEAFGTYFHIKIDVNFS